MDRAEANQITAPPPEHAISLCQVIQNQPGGQKKLEAGDLHIKTKDGVISELGLNPDIQTKAKFEKFSQGLLSDSTVTAGRDCSEVMTDKKGNVKGILYKDGSGSGIEYDANNKPSRVFRFNKEGKLTKDERPEPGGWRNYDAEGKPDKEAWPGAYNIKKDGTIDYKNTDGTLDRWSTDGAKTYYDKPENGGRAISREEADGTKLEYSYDRAGNQTTLKKAP